MAHQTTDLRFGANIIMESGSAGVGVVEFDTGAGIGALAPLRFPATALIEVDWSHRGRRLLLDDVESNYDVLLPEIALGWSDGYWLEIGNVGGDDLLISPSENDLISGSPDYTLTTGKVIRLMADASNITWHASISGVYEAVGPYAGIRTSEMYGLTGKLTSESYGVGLQYLWYSPMPGLTFNSPTSNETTFSATVPGSYVATLSVVDSEGKADTYDYTISLDRVLYVGGVIEDSFTTLQAAIDWINANDVANDALYSIYLNGVVADTIRIVPNFAQVYFNAGSSLPVGVDFTVAGNYVWTGVDGEVSIATDLSCSISAATGHTFVMSAGVSLRASGLLIATNDAAAYAIYGPAGSELWLHRCLFTAGGLYGLFVSTGISLRMYDCVTIGIGHHLSGTATTVSSIRNCRFTGPGNVNYLTLINWSGEIEGCQFQGDMSGTNVVHHISCNAPTSGIGVLLITNCTFRGASLGTGLLSFIKFNSGGAGYTRVSNCTIIGLLLGTVGVHFVGTPQSNTHFNNNTIEAGTHAVLSTSDSAGTLPLAYTNARFYNNSIKGALTNVTVMDGSELVVPDIAITGQSGIRALASADGSTLGQSAGPLVYAWSGAGLTLATPAVATTTVVAAAAGSYTLTLTLSDGANSVSTTKVINFDYILHVGGDSDGMLRHASVSDALTWRATNDPGVLYRIIVHGPVAEPAEIVNMDLVHLHYLAGASSTFAAAGFSWTTAPTNVSISSDRSSPYNPSIIAVGTTISMTSIDAVGINISNVSLKSTGGRAFQTINVDNLYLSDVGTWIIGTDPYCHYHEGMSNLTLLRCSSVGNGIAYSFATALGRNNSAKLLDSYGELLNPGSTSSSSVLYTAGFIAPIAAQDILVANCVLVNNATGNSIAGIPRVVIMNGVSATANVTGARFISNKLIQKVAGNAIVRSTSAHVSRNTMAFFDNSMSGSALGFTNCAPNPAVVVTNTNSRLT